MQTVQQVGKLNFISGRQTGSCIVHEARFAHVHQIIDFNLMNYNLIISQSLWPPRITQDLASIESPLY